MKHSVLLFILVAVICSQVLGNPVDENTAKQLAQNFWKENNIIGVRDGKVFKKTMGDVRFVNVAPQCGYSEFYIFNNEDDKGFVIIAADDCVIPILGYSYDNNFATENLPPNLKGWLDGYAEQIQTAVKMRAEATEEIRAEWECLRQSLNLPIKSETIVNSLVTTTWSQGQYYNMFCPEDNSGPDGHALTGCVATAMAQIFKFWGYPNDAHNVVYHEYEHPVYGTLGANYTYAGGSYYWNSMPNQLTISSTASQKQAVASLMYHCGVSVEMNYGSDESSAYPTAAEIAFRAFFDYNDATLVMKSSYDTDAQWINLLKNELDNGRPVFYSGYGTGGHAFVCDGYNNSNYFWFNWGWGGVANGFFPLNSLTPYTNGNQHNYSFNQQAIINIEPGGTNNYHLLGLDADIEANGDNFMIFPYIPIQEITTEIYNWGNAAFNGSVCAVVYDGEGQYVAESGYINNCQISPMQSSGQLSFTFSESLNILSCKAYVGIYSIENNEPTLVSAYGRHSNPSSFYDYSIIYNMEDRATLVLYSDIEYLPTSIIQYSEINVTTNINNDGITPFIGDYAAALYSINGELLQILSILHEGNGLQPGYHYTNPLNFHCPSVTITPGTYYLAIIQKSEGSDIWYPLHSGPTCDNPEHVNPIRINVVSPAQYTITATTNPSNGGTISGQGEYLEGETCTLIATANYGYTFVNWTENGTQVSTNSNYTFTVTGNRNLIANFQYQPPQQCTINVSAYPSEGGTVNGGGTYQQGQTCTISATNNTGFSFVQWNDGVTSNPRTVTVTQDSTFVAFFRDINNQGSGGFSVSASNKVIISQGNLQYQASTGTWRFAEHQYDYFGETNSNIGPNYDGWIDLFGWGTSGWNCGNTYYHPYDKETGNNAYYYYGPLGNYNLTGNYANSDWGVNNAISNGGNEAGVWKTLSSTEFNYLINSRANATAKRTRATVNGVHGLILLPDSWTLPSGISFVSNSSDWETNDYTLTQWQQLENNGAVFLPTSGYRDYTTVYGVNSNCVYWSTSSWNGYGAMALKCDLSSLDANYYNYMRCVGAAIRLVKNYEEFTIFGQSSPLEGGNTTGSGIYESGETCTLTATPNDNYTFVNWTENGVPVSTNTSYSFTVTNNRTIKANYLFSPTNYYSVNVSANPSIGGSVNGGGTYVQGQVCTVTATTNTGYNFVNWTEGGTQVSNDASYTFNVTSNRNLIANFQAQQQQYVVSVSANPSNAGHVSGGGSFNPGASCTVQATPNSGYVFVNWTENGTQVSSNANYTFEVTGNRVLVANFQTQSFTISVAANPSNGGTVTGGGTYEYGQTCTVSANSANGYNFVNWTENGVQVSTNANYSFTVNDNRSLVANFTSQSYVITATADPLAGGVITGSGGYNYGETCTLTATANTGYTFINWTKNGTQVSTNSTYSFTVTESATYVAHFNLQSYSITVAANPNNGGSVTGGGNYNFGQTCTINATANSGYTFTSWTENGSQVSTNANYSFTVTGNRNLVANFTQNTYTIQASAGANGTITPSGAVVVTHGTSRSFSMIPDAGYEVQEVYIDDNPVGAMTSYTFNNVTDDHYIHVVFSPTVSVDETYENDVVLYPNPTSSTVTIKGKGIETIQVFNALGVMVKKMVVEGKDSIVFDLSDLPCGVYILQLTFGDQVTTNRVIKLN